MSVLVLQELYDRKIDEASEMSTEQLAAELKGSVSNNNGMMSRDTLLLERTYQQTRYPK